MENTMSQFNIERDVPIPTSIGRGARESKYPFAQMEVGDSFAVLDEKQLQSARNAAYQYKTKNPDFNYGAMATRPSGGRLWRIDP